MHPKNVNIQTRQSVIPEIQSAIEDIEKDTALYKEINFNNRANAIDFIDFHIIDRIEGLQQSVELDKLKQRAAKLKHKLEKIDTDLFKQLRKKIRAGSCTKSSFKKLIREYIGYDVSNTDQPGQIGYDNLDIFINGLLSGDIIPEATTVKQPEMVFYQKTPARIIFQLAKLAQLKGDDVLFDIGSGLGQVPILVNLICGTTVKGVEYEPAYCDYAKVCALQLNLSKVEFINADARKVNYFAGTVFFMYTPFEGSMMQEMLEILHKESQKKAIRIFTYGPCSPVVARQNWLTCVNSNADNNYKLYEFRS